MLMNADGEPIGSDWFYSMLEKDAPASLLPGQPVRQATGATDLVLLSLGAVALASVVAEAATGASGIIWTVPAVACFVFLVALLVRMRADLQWQLAEHLYDLRLCNHKYHVATQGVLMALPDHAAEFDQHFPDVAPVLHETWELLKPDVSGPKPRVPSEQLREKWLQFQPQLHQIAKLDTLLGTCDRCRFKQLLYRWLRRIPLPT